MRGASLEHRVGKPKMDEGARETLPRKRAKPCGGPDERDPLPSFGARRGRVLGMSPDDEGGQMVDAEVPMAEMQDFTTFLRQLTQGRGHYTFEFVRYETLPQMLEGKVIEQAKALGNMNEDDA